jgi:predicted HicB family RNase H-like nuclease
MLANDYYTYRVTWSIEDKEYVGLCAEFPSLSWLDASQEAALHGIRQLVADVVSDLQSNSETIPEPLSTKNFSGHFMVRIPPELHRELVVEATESRISLNRLVSNRLGRAHS